MPLLNYTTTISPEKTCSEIQVLLARHGAHQIMLTYDKGAPSGVSFSITTPNGARSFALPTDTTASLAALKKSGAPRRYLTQEQARRVAWRVLKDWLISQLALIEIGMARVDEVLLPYMLLTPGRTVLAEYNATGLRALEK